MEDASTRRTHTTTPPGATTHSKRRPRAHTPSDAPSARHHAVLRERCQLHSLLAAVQCAAAAASHHCCSIAFHCTTQHTSQPRKRIRRANTSASARESPRGAFQCSWLRCAALCAAQRSPCCSACCEGCYAAALSSGPSSSARLLRATTSPSGTPIDARCRLLPVRQQVITITIGGLLLIQIFITHYASRRVRHRTGRLKSPAVRPQCDVCRRLHASCCCTRNTQPCAVETRRQALICPARMLV